MNKLAHFPNGHGRILVAAFILSACTQRDPLDLKVDSSSDVSFAMWRSDAADRLPPQQLRDFDEALQEIKTSASLAAETKGANGSPRFPVEQTRSVAENQRTRIVGACQDCALGGDGARTIAWRATGAGMPGRPEPARLGTARADAKSRPPRRSPDTPG